MYVCTLQHRRMEISIYYFYQSTCYIWGVARRKKPKVSGLQPSLVNWRAATAQGGTPATPQGVAGRGLAKAMNIGRGA